MTITVYDTNIKSNDLQLIPNKELQFVIRVTHAWNELNVIFKTFVASTNDVGDSDYQKKASVSQTVCFAKIFIGKLLETWRIIESEYYGGEISKFYNTRLSEAAQESLKRAKRRFKNKNDVINKIRNKYAFHYDAQIMNLDNLRDVSSEDDQIWLSDSRLNCLFFVSDAVVNHGFLQLYDQDPQKAFESMVKDFAHLANDVFEFLDGVITVILESNIGCITNDEEEIKVPAIQKLSLPFFLDLGEIDDDGRSGA